MAQQYVKRKSVPMIPDLEGPPLVLPVLSTGLGTRFYDKLCENKQKLHQVDAMTGVTETKESVKMRAVQVATEMKLKKIKPNEVVVICSKNHLDQTVAILGCLFIGAVIAPVCPDLPYDEFKQIIVDLKPKIAFCDSRAARLMERILQGGKLNCDIYIFKGDPQDFMNFCKCFEHKLDDMFMCHQVTEPNKTVAFIMCTHGSEREPKLVLLSHTDIFARYIPMAEPFKKKSEKILSFFSVCWIVQILLNCVCFETQGVIIFPGQVTERGVCKYVHDLKIEHLYLPSQMAVDIVHNAPLLDFDLSCLKDMYIAGISLSHLNYTKLRMAFPGVNIKQSYKVTEVGDITSLPDGNDDTKKDTSNSIGKLQPGVTARLVDVQTRQSLGPDQWGELLVKTPGMMRGYYKNQLLTSRALTKGFFKTGDIVLYDNEGYFYMKGRIDSVIKKNNHSFFATEVEEVLMAHPLINEAAVFEVDVEIVACIVLKEGHELSSGSILEYAAEELPDYKLPTKVKFYDHFPKTLHGIIKKYVLKDSAIKLIREESFYHSEVIDDSESKN